jgi:hypothetical protein
MNACALNGIFLQFTCFAICNLSNIIWYLALVDYLCIFFLNTQHDYLLRRFHDLYSRLDDDSRKFEGEKEEYCSGK